MSLHNSTESTENSASYRYEEREPTPLMASLGSKAIIAGIALEFVVPEMVPEGLRILSEATGGVSLLAGVGALVVAHRRSQR